MTAASDPTPRPPTGSPFGSKRDVALVVLASVLLTLLLLALSVVPAMAQTAGGSAAEPSTVQAPGLLGSSAALFVGVAALFAGLAIAAYRFLRPEGAGAVAGDPHADARSVLAARHAAIQRSRPGLSEITGKASAVADRTLAKRGWNRALDTSLENAGLDLRAGEYCVLAGAVAGGLFLFGFLVGGLASALLLGLLAVFGARVYLSQRRDRRRVRFGDQLGDLLQQLAASLRAGHGLMQAVEGAAREAESPTKEELRRLVTEIRLGRDFVTSLDAVADRMDNEDFRWVASAIRIHREVGGDLSQVLDRVGETIRSRAQLHRQVRALSAEGRMSAWVLSILPVAVGLLIAMINPASAKTLTSSSMGISMLLFGFFMMVFGGVWLKTIIRIKV